MTNRAIILPYKEDFSDKNSGAASIFVKESLAKENLKDFIIYGSKSNISNIYKKIFFFNQNPKRYFSNYNYIQFFIKKFLNKNFKTIEIHNRPEYIKKIRETFPTSKIIFYFHNDPNTLRGSKTAEEKKYIIRNCQIVFLSKWIRKQFGFKNLKKEVNYEILYPGIKKIKKLPLKKNIIFFCGKLNRAKGYDIFIEATKKFKKNNLFKDWKIISAGTESRRTIPREKHIKELGQISNSEVIKFYKLSKISIAPSVWNEPLGRLPIEASAMGCIPITTSKGGLPETNLGGFVLKKNNADELCKILIKLASNKSKIKKIGKKIIQNFIFTDLKFLQKVKKLRSEKKINKILMIANMNNKNKKRLFYSFFNKIKLGIHENNLKLNIISDRDFLRKERSLIDPLGIRKFNKEVLNKVINYKPDLLILGHTNRIYLKTFLKIREINKDIKIVKFYIDSISKEFFNFDKVFYDYMFLNNIFISSSKKIIDKFDFKEKIFFIPYPVNKKIDFLKSYNFKKKEIDVFFALSHGQNRGVLKKGRVDEREDIIKKLNSILPISIKTKFLGINGAQPVWGREFYNLLNRCKITLNISRGVYKDLYSSDRISTLLGNGCFVLNEKINNYNKLYSQESLKHFKNVNDLKKLIIYYLKNSNKRKEISEISYKISHRYYNSKIIFSYILDIISNNYNNKLKKSFFKKYIWHNV